MKKNPDFIKEDPKEVKWTKETILKELKQWIDEEKWEGQTHLSKHNSGLYNAIRRNMGMIGAFRELGLSYYDYKKKKGSKWTEEVILSELEKCLKGKDSMHGVKHLQKKSIKKEKKNLSDY